MDEFLVSWEIDIFDGADARDAAQRALDIVADPKSWGHVFTVTNKTTGETVTIDLDDEEVS